MFFPFIFYMLKKKVKSFFYNKCDICALIMYLYCILIDMIIMDIYLYNIELVMLEVNY